MFKNRIRSQEGATILIALLFFLLCAVAGVIILTAGTSAAGKANGVVTEQQSYYSVTSAAKLLEEEINSKQIDCYIMDGSQTVSFYTEPDSNIKIVLEKAVGAFLLDKKITEYDDKLIISPENDSYKKDVGYVTGDFHMDSDYKITIRLYVADAEGSTTSVKNSYICELVVPAAIQEGKDKAETELIDSDGTSHIRTETKLIWTEGQIIKAS